MWRIEVERALDRRKNRLLNDVNAPERLFLWMHHGMLVLPA